MDYSPSPVRTLASPGRSMVSRQHSPGTPKLPFDPPRRRSSLAFSKIISSPSCMDKADGLDNQDVNMQTPDRPTSNVGTRLLVATPFKQSGASSRYSTQVQKLFQSAKETLHMDMHFAASPAGSIDSRLPSNLSPTLESHVEDPSYPRDQGMAARYWRYSTVPQLLATTNLDVREPLPDTSPILPGIQSHSDHQTSTPFEPTSSGFASPVESMEQDVEIELPPLPPSSPPVPIQDDDPITALEDPLTSLKVYSDDYVSQSHIASSPVVDHQRGRLSSLSDSPIYLSQSASAAAESAKAKRGLLRRLDPSLSNADTIETNTAYRESTAPHTPEICPDPAIHHLIGSRLCPDPAIHGGTPRSVMGCGFGPNTQRVSDIRQATRTSKLQRPVLPAMRASATGSPLPFSRSRGPVSPILPGGFPRQAQFFSHSPVVNRISRPCRPTRSPGVTKSEHFQPGWHYARDSPQKRNRSGADVYSFSTAASKAIGEPPTSDWRIRDSYRTDTLTPLVKPLNRFRKNGLGAEINPRGSARFYGPPPSPARSIGRMKSYSNRNDYESIDRVRFRSSPPRPSTSNIPGRDLGKRRRNPRAYTPELDMQDSSMVDPRYEPDDPMIIDDDTRAAVRMSVFGTGTPEPLHGEREGIRELSPNVSTWRKGMRGGPQSRKKRRPSYWDGDLKEVKDSPAGQGGIASSPTISKRSMVAEMESITSRSAAVSIDYDIPTVDGRVHEVESQDYTVSLEDESMPAQDLGAVKVSGDSMEDIGEMEMSFATGAHLTEIDMLE